MAFATASPKQWHFLQVVNQLDMIAMRFSTQSKGNGTSALHGRHRKYYWFVYLKYQVSKSLTKRVWALLATRWISLVCIAPQANEMVIEASSSST